MGFFDRFKKPKWKDKNPEVRLEGLKELDDKDIIINLAGNDENWKVRSEAIERIEDENVLSNLYESEADSIVRMKIAGKITDSNILADIVKKDPDDDVRSAAVENITSEDLLLYIINNDSSVYVRKDATYRLAHVAEDMKVFEILSREGKPDDIRILAADLMANSHVNAMVGDVKLPDEDSYKSKSFKYLSDLISGENEISLDFDIEIRQNEVDEYENGIILDRDIVIDGNDHFIDAKKMARIFNVTEDAKVTFKNIRFLNASSVKNESKGCAIYNESDKLTVEGCEFKGNAAITDRSGASAIYSTDSITITDCLFEDNTNAEYASLHIKRINETGQRVKISDCIFKNNRTYNGNASAIHIHIEKAKVELTNCHFKDNITDKGSGGACYFNGGDFTLERCDFTKNSASDGEGSAIYMENYASGDEKLHLKRCTFKNNYTDSKNRYPYYNGCGTVYSTNTFLICERCTFNDNKAILASAICNQNADCNIIRSTFENPTNSTGSMFLQLNERANTTIELSSFTSNSPTEEIIRMKEGFCTIRNSKFFSKGRAIYSHNANVEIYASEFHDRAPTIYSGNVIKIERDSNLEEMIEQGSDAKPIMYLKEAIDNTAKGATYLDEKIHSGSEIIELDDDIIFDEKEQNFYEGGIEIDRDDITIDGHDHTIDADGLSRIFYITAKNITLKNIRFKNAKYFKNRLDDEYSGGGAIFTTYDSSLSLINCKFIENTSQNSGAAITNRGELILVENCRFEKNTSKSNGTLTNRKNYISLTGCCFKSNMGNKGGAISSLDGIATVKDTIFEKNTSHHRGGGAIYSDGGEMSVINSTFNTNQINYQIEGGGAIYNNKSLMKIKKSHFNKNRAVNGGAIYNSYGQIIINESDFKYNLAKIRSVSGKGDEIYNDSEKGMTITKSHFDNPESKIIFNRGELEISSTHFNPHHSVEGDSPKFVEKGHDNTFGEHKQISTEEYKIRFIEAMDVKNEDLANEIALEWSEKYPKDFEGHYAYIISNSNGEIEDLRYHFCEADRYMPKEERGKNEFEKKAEMILFIRHIESQDDFYNSS